MTPIIAALLLFYCVQNSDSFKLQLTRRFHSCRSLICATSDTYDFDMVRPQVEFSLGETIEVSSFLKDYDAGAKIQGVYAVQDAAGTVLYVGSSMSMPTDIQRLSMRLGNDVVNTLRIQTFPNPKPDAIEAYKLELIRQLSPSGNIDNYEMWEDKAIVREVVVEDVSVKPVVAEKETKISSSRERLADAVDSDGRKAGADVVESPFTEGDAYIIGPNSSTGIEFTKENVDKVLDEVRPYLIADGGNVEVVSVDEFTRSVSLALQGACGSCPSSTTTMKMGIERVLKENFTNLGPVLQVTPVVAATGLTMEAVSKALEKVLPAIKAMGGIVKVTKVDSTTGAVFLGYKGPARLKVGIQLVMKDLSLVTAVTIEDLIEEGSNEKLE